MLQDIEVNGIRLRYREAGSGPETVVFSHSYLVDHRHFDAQIEALSDRYRVLAYDHRDHGGSARATAPYSMATLTDDGEAFVRATVEGPCHWVGLSTGGFVGMRIALRSPELFSSLTLMDTSAQPEPGFNRVKYEVMLAMLRTIGFKPLAAPVMKQMFGEEFLRDPDREAERALWRDRMQANDPKALTRFGHAIFGRDDVLPALSGLRVPTLVVVGSDDRSTTPDKARAMAATIPGARLEFVPGGGHLNTIEKPELVSTLLTDFLGSASAGA